MIAKFLNRKPKIAKTAFVAPDAQLIGSVEIGGHSSIWFNVVARADINKIKIGSYTNIQDGSVLHVDDELGVLLTFSTHMGKFLRGIFATQCNTIPK